MEKNRNAIEKALENILTDALRNIEGETIPWVALDSKIELLEIIATDILDNNIEENMELLKRVENAKINLTNKDFVAMNNP